MASFFIQKTTLNDGSARFRARIKHQNRFIRTKTFKRRADANEWAIHFVANLDSFLQASPDTYVVSFSELVNEYGRQWRGTDAVRPTALRVFSEFFGEKIISEISVDDCRRLLSNWAESQPATYNKFRSILVAIFDFAIIRQEETGMIYLSENPAKKVRPKPIDNKRVRFLSDEEKPRLVAACRQIGGKFYLAFLLALSTGLRKSNVLHLRWQDVDFKRGLLTVSRTKNGDPITAPVPSQVIDLLSEYRQVGNAYIFESELKSGVPCDYKKQWIRAREMAEIENFRWHDLRHDAASTLARDGRTLLEIAEILGHRSLQSTQRYAHLSVGHKQKIVNETMGSVLDGLL